MGLFDKIKGLGSKIVKPIIKPYTPTHLIRNTLPSFTNTGQRIIAKPSSGSFMPVHPLPSFTNTGHPIQYSHGPL